MNPTPIPRPPFRPVDPERHPCDAGEAVSEVRPLSEPRYTYRDVDPEWENEWQVEDADGIAATCADEDDAERIAACLNACGGVEDLAGLDVAALLKERAELREALESAVEGLREAHDQNAAVGLAGRAKTHAERILKGENALRLALSAPEAEAPR